jgi:hypothetical protein
MADVNCLLCIGKKTNQVQYDFDQLHYLFQRFSEVAGAKLTDDNPNITDLSDPNRPIKIGEQFSELYDNAWTDAFEKLTGESKLSERDSIHILLDILQVIGIIKRFFFREHGFHYFMMQNSRYIVN